MQHFFLFCLLALTVLAVERDTETIPSALLKSNFKYEGTLKAPQGEFPITGDFFLHSDDEHIDLLDKMNLDLGDKTWTIRDLTLVNMADKLLRGYYVINNNCIPSEYKKTKRTFPMISPWRKISENKFERTISSRVSLNRILKNNIPRIGALGSEEHQVRVRFVVTLDEDKVSKVKKTVFVDDELLYTVNYVVTSHMQNNKSNHESIFRVPSVCRTFDATKTRRGISLLLLLLEQNPSRIEGQFNERKSEDMENDEENEDEAVQFGSDEEELTDIEIPELMEERQDEYSVQQKKGKFSDKMDQSVPMKNKEILEEGRVHGRQHDWENVGTEKGLKGEKVGGKQELKEEIIERGRNE